MSEEYDNEMRGVLFKNDRKTKSNQPDYRGTAQLNNVEYWVSGWIKTPRAGGAKFMSIAFQEKETEFKEGSGDNQPSQDFDTDIPFADPYKYTWRAV